ncbi:hypothetical protein K4F52_010286 [Lecanicillium sp. MT-2017a]|nr:hypothetical protein K4F52_010286 [Lecanicillium sp. MT-2017a]
MSGKGCAKVIRVLTRGSLDDNSTISVRFNGCSFDISLSPDFFRNSPHTTDQYLRYLKVIHPAGPGEFEGIDEEEVFDWVIDTFQPLFNECAPEAPPSFDPDKIRSGEAKPVLSEYLFPKTFGCRLDAQDETLLPRCIDDRGRFVPPRTYLDGDFLDDLETWTTLYEPTAVRVEFSNPDHALDRMPSRVTVQDKSGCKMTCYFKGFGVGLPRGPLQRELEAYKKIHFSEGRHLGRLLGVVHEEKTDAILGMLLQYIDCEGKGTLDDRLWDEHVLLELRTRWAAQVKSAVKALHDAGAVWGDAKPSNILIDQEDNAWLTDFEGGYTEGWVDRDKAGTVEGDLQGLERIVKDIFEERKVESDTESMQCDEIGKK